MTGNQEYAHRFFLANEAERLDIDVVPEFGAGLMDLDKFQSYMKKESFLGGQTVEGVVIKNYGRFCEDTGHVMMGKYVSESFKEVHRKEWAVANQTQKDIMEKLIATYKTPARWEKAVYRLRDNGDLLNAPQDIGKIIKEVWPDIVAECEDEIKQTLWDHFSKQLQRGVVVGLPEWYKLRLAHQQFEDINV